MYIIGIDLGGTQLRVRLCDRDKQVLGESRVIMEDKKPSSVVQRLVDEIGIIRREADLEEGPCDIAFAVAGMLDPDGRVVQNAPNLRWFGVPLAEQVQGAIPEARSVRLYNDLDAATWGEFMAGVGQGVEHMVAVFAGSGVGSGMVLNQRLHHGASGVAGEIGHIKVVLNNGRTCGCGAQGCLEAYTGGHQLAKIARDAALQNTKGYLWQRLQEREGEPLSAKDIAEGEQQNDSTCIGLTRQTAQYLGWGISHLITLVNPELLVFGGGVLLNWPRLRELTEAHLRECLSTPAQEKLRCVTAKLGDDAGLVGAVELALLG